MSKLPIVTPAQTIKALESAGFFVHRIKGSHHILRHRERNDLRVIVAFKKREIPRGTLNAIIKQAGLTVDEFIDLL